jgi:4-diphosphocytidyl-2C-methyl-D-erythritol kinase
MKKISFTALFAILAIAVLAQTPQGISHQAVIRDAANELVINSPIGIRVSIIQSSAEGTIVYSETHTPMSNANGLITFIIGQGTSNDDFSEIDWAIGPYFIKTEVDPAGGNIYTITGTSQLLSVPYSFYSETSGITSEWNKNGNNLYYNAGNVGIGTTSPSTNLVVKSSGYTNGMYVNSSNDLPIFRVRQDSDQSGSLYLYDGSGINKVVLRGAGISYFNSGYVGIGTTSPSTNLVVKSSGYTHGMYVNSSNDLPIFRVRQNNDQSGSLYLYDGNGIYNVAMSGSGTSYFNAGFVGIGTTSPSTNLVVKSSGNTHGMYVNSSNDLPIFRVRQNNDGSGSIYLYDSTGTSRVALSGSGKTYFNASYVGIGTSNPSSGLHIKGAQYPESFLFLESANSQDAGIRLYEGTTDKWHIFNNSTLGGLHIYNTSGQTVLFASQSNGNVGIGTTSPSTNLVVKSSGNTHGMYVNSSDDQPIFRVRQNSDESGSLYLYDGNGTSKVAMSGSGASYFNAGFVGIGTTSPSSRLDVKGNVTIRDNATNLIVVELGAGLDYAEGFNVSDKHEIEPGTVLSIDAQNSGKLIISKQEYDTKVAGIVAGAKSLGSGISLGSEAHDCNVALAGRVYCNVDATEEAIAIGDLLTTSSIPGYAMKVIDKEKAQGAILGKAMESLAKGEKGQILVLVTLQ